MLRHYMVGLSISNPSIEIINIFGIGFYMAISHKQIAQGGVKLEFMSIFHRNWEACYHQ